MRFFPAAALFVLLVACAPTDSAPPADVAALAARGEPEVAAPPAVSPVGRALALASQVRARAARGGAEEGARLAAGELGGFAPLFLRARARFGGVVLADERLPERCAAMLAAIAELPAHALAPEPYEASALASACASGDSVAQVIGDHREGPFDDPAGRAAWALAILALDGASREQLEEAAGEAGEASEKQWATVERWLEDVVAAEALRSSAGARADAMVVRAFLRYAMDFRYLRRTDPYRRPDALDARLAAVADSLLEHLERARADMASELAVLRPAHPLYEALRGFLEVYRALAASGEITSLSSDRRLKLGMSGPDVSALRERLRAEGFAPGPPGESFDAALREAVLGFQRLRGVAPLGEVGPQTVEALNVSIAARLRQIEISLQRWRESGLREAEGRHLRVNLPRYSLALWEGARVLRRHRVIVGSDRLVTDLSAGLIGHLNRTRTLDSAIYQVILNPYWRVPKRIAIQEIGPEAERDPAYLATKGIKLTEGPGGEPLYIQSPGEHNPLGQVKFLFRNDWALYLHDTDKRWLFGESRRAFSHGCVRVDEPLALAREIAHGALGMEEAEFNRLVRMGTEYGLDIEPPLPIHIQYMTAEVDEDGALLLLPDLYRYDRDVREGRLPSRESRPIKPEEIEREKKRRAEAAKKGR